MPFNTKKNLDGVSEKMLIALNHAWSLQKAGKDFSLSDLDGSKAGLVNRELIEIVTIYKNKKEVNTWRVTTKGKAILKENNLLYT